MLLKGPTLPRHAGEGQSKLSALTIELRGFLDGRQTRQRHRELFLVVVLIDQLAREVIRVGLHVEVAVAAQVEEDRA